MMKGRALTLWIGGAMFAAALAWYGFTAFLTRTGSDFGTGFVPGGTDMPAHATDEKSRTTEADLALLPRESATITIGTPRGSVVVQNFYRNPLAVREMNEVVIAETSVYTVSYIRNGAMFTIVVHAQPVRDAWLAAEADFLAKLDINKEDACKLDTSVIIPVPIDETLGGVHELSFCGGSAYYVEKPPEW